MARTKQSARKAQGGYAPRSTRGQKSLAGFGFQGYNQPMVDDEDGDAQPDAAAAVSTKEHQAELEKIQNVFEEVSDDMILTAVTTIEDSPDGLKCTRDTIRDQIIKTHYKYKKDPNAILSFKFDALFNPSFEEALKEASEVRDLITKIERDGEEVYEKSANFHEEDLVGLTECQGCFRKVLMKAAQVCSGPGCSSGQSARFCERCIGKCAVCGRVVCHGVCRPLLCEKRCKIHTGQPKAP